MSTPESRAALIAWRSTKRVSGSSVVLSRPGGGSGNVTAVAGDTLVETEDDDARRMKLKVRDYLIGRADFETIIGAGELPKRGDEIVEVVADYTRTFRVIEINGESSRWWDKAGQVLRIHAVEFEKVTTTAGA